MKKDLKIRGIKIIFDDLGEGDVILLIHGQPFNRSMWKPQTDVFAENFRLIIPDLRGYGDSGITEGIVLLDELALDLIHLLAQLKIPKAHIIGLSMGGQIALELFCLKPGLLKSLVLAGTDARAEDEKGYQNRLRLSGQILKEGMDKFTDERLRYFMCSNSFEHKPDVVAHVQQMMRTTNPAGSAAVQIGRAERLDYTPSLSNIDFPVLIIVGDQDEFTPVASAEYLYSKIKSSRLEVIKACGHISNMEQSEKFNSILLEFYRSQFHSDLT